MQTDTVVGIVGAVVLVSVMVGVFAYEYNNTGEDGGGGDGDGADGDFAQRYPGLEADGDIDGDGTPNVDDLDMDGDGAPDQNDTELAVTTQFDGTVTQSAGSTSSSEETFSVAAGATQIVVTASYDRPTPLPAQQAPRLNFRLTDPNGNSDYEAQVEDASAPGTVTTVTFDFGSDILPAGEWTLTISSSSLLSPAMNYDGSATVLYS